MQQPGSALKVGQQVMHSAAHRGVQPPAAPVARLQFTRTRTGEIQSRITNDICGMSDGGSPRPATSIASNLDGSHRRHRRRDDRLVLATVADLVTVMPPATAGLTARSPRSARAVHRAAETAAGARRSRRDERVRALGRRRCTVSKHARDWRPRSIDAVHRVRTAQSIDRRTAARDARRSMEDGQRHEHHRSLPSRAREVYLGDVSPSTAGRRAALNTLVAFMAIAVATLGSRHADRGS